MEELLEKQMEPLKLEDKDKDFLRTSLKTGKFSKGAAIIAKKLREKRKYDRAQKLEDMGPMFDPHDFWNNQPVPRLNEKIDVSLCDQPIEVKTLDQVNKEPYMLPEGYFWENLDLSDMTQATELYALLT